MANSAFSSVYGGDDGSSFFDINPEGSYMDMLAFQDYGAASLFDLIQQPTSPPRSLMAAQSCNALQESSEVVNTPTVNSCSISSSSNEAGNDFDQENNTTKSDDDHHANQQLKVKKKNPKKQKQPRFAFMTKTEVDHMDDGYRWRKYGQKAVKNSPFPRSYYRCTSPSCGVKKMVERSSEDPSTLVTTYEGTHIHPCPMTPRGMLTEAETYGGLNGRGGGVSSYMLPQQNYQQPQQPFFYNQNSLSFDNTVASPSSYSHYLQERQSCPSPLQSSLFKDHGLLQDMLSFQIRKEGPS